MDAPDVVIRSGVTCRRGIMTELSCYRCKGKEIIPHEDLFGLVWECGVCGGLGVPSDYLGEDPVLLSEQADEIIDRLRKIVLDINDRKAYEEIEKISPALMFAVDRAYNVEAVYKAVDKLGDWLYSDSLVRDAVGYHMGNPSYQHYRLPYWIREMRKGQEFREKVNNIKKMGKKICPRCGGMGGRDEWKHTGYTCFRCRGEGWVE